MANPMFERLEDVTVEFADGGLRRRELFRHIWNYEGRRGPWATVMFVYQDLNLSRGGWQPPHCRFVRYRYVGYRWRQYSAMNMATDCALDMLAELTKALTERPWEEKGEPRQQDRTDEAASTKRMTA